MSASTDKAKGRVKHAAPDLTGDKDLQREAQAGSIGKRPERLSLGLKGLL